VINQRISLLGYDHLTLSGGGAFAVYVRVPKWVAQGFIVKINGKPQSVNAVPGTYLNLGRTWKDGDIIEMKMPMHFHLVSVMDQPNIASIFYGPILLAAEEPASLTSWRKVTLNAEDIGKSFTGDPATLRYSTNGVNFKPFYEIYGRHSVYLDITLE
jgi:hypothetical protein